jgi:hypothetical protein
LLLLIAAVPLASAEPVRPPPQTAFLAAVTQARDQFKAARNDMERSEARVARKTAICLALPQRTARDWIGRIYRLSSNSEGKVVVGIAIGPDVYVTTWNNSLSDIGDNTLIPADSPVFQALAVMRRDDPVKFSGTFIVSNVDCVKETSLTQEGSMTAPEFLLRFSLASRAR